MKSHLPITYCSVAKSFWKFAFQNNLTTEMDVLEKRGSWHLSLWWILHCNRPPVNMVNFLQILAISTLELVSECEVWVFCALSASSVFWLIVIVSCAKFIIKKKFYHHCHDLGRDQLFWCCVIMHFRQAQDVFLLGGGATNDLETFSHRLESRTCNWALWICNCGASLNVMLWWYSN